MKKFFLFICVMMTSLKSFTQLDQALPAIPDPPRLVNDFTGNTLADADREKLEHKLVKFDQRADVQIAVVILDNTHGYASDEFAKALGNKWGIGNKQKNNGIIILVTTGGGEGKRDLTIQLGKAYAGYPVDDILKEIIVEMIPSFKEGKMYEGLDKGTDMIMEAIDKLNEMTGSSSQHASLFSIVLNKAG